MSNQLSLDFANTAGWHAGPDPDEGLASYVHAVEWAREHGVLDDTQATAVLEKARMDPSAEARALSRVIATREAVYHVLSAAAHHREPAENDMLLLDEESRRACEHLRLAVLPAEAAGQGAGAAREADRGTVGSDAFPRFVWVWSGLEDDLTGFLWPVAKAATDLLTSRQLSQLRECAGHPCGWLFLDLSKNGSRRWCDMSDCGNRAKARRYRERRKTTVPAPEPVAAEATEP